MKQAVTDQKICVYRAVIYKCNKIKKIRFDKKFGVYGYLEDLDFSLNLLKSNKKIYLSSKSKFMHPNNIDRSSS